MSEVGSGSTQNLTLNHQSLEVNNNKSLIFLTSYRFILF